MPKFLLDKGERGVLASSSAVRSIMLVLCIFPHKGEHGVLASMDEDGATLLILRLVCLVRVSMKCAP